MENLLCRYTRPFTVLDVNAGKGQFSFQIAKKYPDSVCVMLEPDPELVELCQRNKFENVILLTASSTPDFLQHLSECEHFDVVLVSGLTSAQPGWQAAMDACRNMGHHLFFWVSGTDQPVRDHLISQGAKALQNFFYVESAATWTLRRKTWMRSPMKQENYSLTCSFSEKQFEKPVANRNLEKKITISWAPGINLCTFKMCGGVYPTNQQLKKSLLRCTNKGHTDWMVNNMILQGVKIHLIDGDDALGDHRFANTLIEAHQTLLDLQDPKKVQHYFWEELLYTPPSDRQVVKFFQELFPPLSLVFEVGSEKIERLHQYLGYGSKVICYHPSLRLAADVEAAPNKEGLHLITDPLLSLDEETLSHGLPHFCCIHLDPRKGNFYLKTLSKPIPALAWKFTMENGGGVLDAIRHLKSIGYKEFNFSIRHIPHLYLSNNKYTGIERKWVSEPQTLWKVIEESAALDPAPSQFWGYVYARI